MHRSRLMHLLVALLACVPYAVQPHVASAATLTFVVTTTTDASDAAPGDGRCATTTSQCTLRAAAQEASAQPRGSTITVAMPRGVYRLPLGPLALLGNTIAISGTGMSATLLVGQGSQVMTVARDAQTRLSGLTITGGQAGAGGGGGLANAGSVLLSASLLISNTAATGGGITNTGRLILSQSLVVSNTAANGDGGGLANAGALFLSRSAVLHNTATTGGGGIANELGSTATLSASTLMSNTATTAVASGGGINNGGAMTLIATTISRKTAAFAGGGISTSGPMTLTNSVVSANSASSPAPVGENIGGGINNNGTLTLTKSSVSGNATDGIGGGIYNFGRLTAVASTLSRNIAQGGGAVYNADFGTLTLQGSAMISNTAPGSGGATYNDGGIVTVANSTLSGNTAQHGGGIKDSSALPGPGSGMVTLSYVTLSANAGNISSGIGGDPVQLTGTIVANSTSGPNCSDYFIESQGYNLDSGTSCSFIQPTDLSATDPLLAPLAYNGGPTPTLALLPGSPAMDHGGTSANGCPATDQRGVVRPQGLACDIGAYEAKP